MARQFISEHRLLEKINNKLASDDECCEYTVRALMQIDADDMGCNWSVAAMSGPLSTAGSGSSQAELIIMSFKRLYNLRSDPARHALKPALDQRDTT